MVVPDDFVGSVQDLLRGTVILFQTDHFGAWEDFFEIQDIADVCAPEFIDALVVIAYDAEIAVFGCEQADEAELRGIGILVFIHHNISEAFLIDVEYVRIGFEDFHRFHDEIVEIHGVASSQLLLISAVEHADALPVKILIQKTEFFRGYQFVFRGGNAVQDSFRVEPGSIDVFFLHQVLHQGFLVVGVIDREVAGISEELGFPAEYSHAQGVEGADVDLLRAETDHLVHAPAHLVRCFICKRNSEDLGRRDSDAVQKPGNPVHQHPRLSGTGARKDEHRAIRRKDGFLLLRVQLFRYLLYIHPVSSSFCRHGK